MLFVNFFSLIALLLLIYYILLLIELKQYSLIRYIMLDIYLIFIINYIILEFSINKILIFIKLCFLCFFLFHQLFLAKLKVSILIII